ncbi:MAG TPA: histidine kinase dimerization/phosphoacceptor domain -containing protein [Candidatus Eisenbacteria bacterium]|nr:histidine kinase dimerization/phosphoacceptor domain -containing protein [Candidatus Eisenbacteria bacterium]
MASGTSDGDKVGILVVDDQPSQLLSHEAILSELGERLVMARSGREALQRLMDEDFAVILLDVNMPDMDGFETASLIHQHPRFEKTPIVFVTGAQPTTLDRLKGYRVGAVDYVEVPVVPEILRSKVAVFVDLERQRRDLQRLNEALQAEIAQRRNAEEAARHSREKEVLLQEIHHRVKNNLQIITSLLRMQSRAVQDPALSEALRECQNRVASMALIHDKLYRARDLARVSFGEYVRDLTNNILTSYALPARSVRVRLDIDDLSLSLDCAVPCGLILNELMSNCLKHAFPVGHSGTVYVGFHVKGDDELCLVVQDDGVGMPADVDLGRTSSLGWRLIRALVEQLGGVVRWQTASGTSVEIRFARQNALPDQASLVRGESPHAQV